MKPATKEQIELLNKFLTDNKFILNASVITEYPEGIAKTYARVQLLTEEEKVEETKQE